MKKLIIFPGGREGRLLNRIIKNNMIQTPYDRDEVVFFCDNNMISGSYIEGVEVIHPDELAAYDKNEFIILVNNNALVDVLCKQLYSLNVEIAVHMIPDYVFHMRWNPNSGLPFSISVNITKPRLPYLEVQITTECNLKCKGCIAMCNVNNAQTMKLELFEKNLRRLKELFWGIKYLKIFGGEPLLHEEINRFAKVARLYFPDSELVIHSNGLAIHKMDEDFFDMIHDCDIQLLFTQYPPTGKIKRRIENKLRMKDIRFLFTEPVYEFRRSINMKGSLDSDDVYRNCSKCINLINGTLSCGIGYVINDLEEFYNVKIYEDKFENSVDIHHTSLDGWQINNFLNRASNLCSYCSFMNYLHTDEKNFYQWSSSGKAEFSDWVEV